MFIPKLSLAYLFRTLTHSLTLTLTLSYSHSLTHTLIYIPHSLYPFAHIVINIGKLFRVFEFNSPETRKGTGGENEVREGGDEREGEGWKIMRKRI